MMLTCGFAHFRWPCTYHVQPAGNQRKFWKSILRKESFDSTVFKKSPSLPSQKRLCHDGAGRKVVSQWSVRMPEIRNKYRVHSAPARQLCVATLGPGMKGGQSDGDKDNK